MPRIVSLLPSATEWVHALGLAGDLLGVTFECDHPPDPRVGRAVVVGGLDTTGLDPAGIDALVRAKVAAGEQLYTLDVEALARLRPEVVLTQDLCRVCALPAGELDLARAAVGGPAAVVSLDPHTLPEVLDGVLQVADACGVPDRGRELRAGLQARLDAVAAGVAAAAGATGRARPRVLVVEWVDPPYVAGHWVPDLVAAAGGDPVLAVPGGRSVPVDPAELARSAAGADAVLVGPCGYGLEQACEQAVEQVLPLLPAGARRPPVWAVDAGAVLTRPGPRVVDGVEALAAAWYPGVTPDRPDLVRRVA